ncbi:MAG: rod shape-determining protein MreC [Eubacteriaceae bacterium]|nr:rod shape-determining protein MreC [Eubacteriaceae bacterium]
MKWMKEHRFGLMITLIMFMLVTGIGMTSQGRDRTTLPESLVSSGVSPLSRVVYYSSQYIHNFYSFVTELSTLKSRNEALEQELHDYKIKLTDYDKLTQENKELKSLLSFMDEHANFEYISGSIVSIDPDSGFSIFVINRGSNDGVQVNMTVVLKEGLVGRITEVSGGTSKVLAITDQNSMFNGVCVRTRDYVRITGDDNYKLKGYVDTEAKIEAGDIVLTSGLSGAFKKDIVIGEVLEVKKQQGKLEKLVVIEPAVEVEKINNVLIIK